MNEKIYQNQQIYIFWGVETHVKNLILKVNLHFFRDSNNCVVILVKEEQEPLSFQMIFQDWE